MPILSRRVFLQKQKKRQKLEQMRKIRKVVNTGLVMFSTAVFAPITLKSTNVIAQTATSTGLSKSNFLSLISESARKIAAENDLYASVMIAQAILETGWGKSTLSQAPYHNLFGIKGASTDATVNMKTLEDDGKGNLYSEYANFKRYNSYAESMSDYAAVLTGNNDPSNWRYNHYLGARVSQTNSYTDATAHLTGRYATDTKYASSLNRLIEENNLTVYDSVSRSSAGRTNTTATATVNVTTTAGGRYTVTAGDTYWSLARKYGVTVTQLQQLNGATNGNLSVGQVLVVPGATNSGTTIATTNATPAATTINNSVGMSVSNSSGNYTVVAGDTYWSLAKRFGVTVAQLQSLNGASSSTLSVGQTLKVPSATATTSISNSIKNDTTVSISTKVTNNNNYTVVAGDSYWGIARRLGISVNELMSVNGNKNLHPGQVLVVPGGATASVNSVTQSTVSVEVPIVQTANSATTVSAGNYTVVAGDSLYAIARRHNTTVAQILQANGIVETAVIYPGQKLIISGAPATVSTSVPITNTVTSQSTIGSEPVVTSTTSTGGSYTVVAGDTLYSIARRLGLSVDTLVANNGGSTNIGVGQVIKY